MCTTTTMWCNDHTQLCSILSFTSTCNFVQRLQASADCCIPTIVRFFTSLVLASYNSCWVFFRRLQHLVQLLQAISGRNIDRLRCQHLSRVLLSFRTDDMETKVTSSFVFVIPFRDFVPHQSGWCADLFLRLRNDLYCVGWGVKLYSLSHSLALTLLRALWRVVVFVGMWSPVVVAFLLCIAGASARLVVSTFHQLFRLFSSHVVSVSRSYSTHQSDSLLCCLLVFRSQFLRIAFAICVACTFAVRVVFDIVAADLTLHNDWWLTALADWLACNWAYRDLIQREN